MTDRTTAPLTKPFGHLHLPEPTVETLSNGLTLHHYSGGEQYVCRLTVKIPFGGEYAASAAPSILASQLTEGTKHHLPEQFAEILDYNGASVNAHASEYFITVTLNTLTNRLPALLPLVAEMLSEPYFDPERLENARLTTVNNLLTSRRDPAVIASEAIKPFIFGKDHPASIIRQPEDIMAVDRPELQDLHDSMLNPEKIHIMLSGRLTEDTIASARTTLSQIKPIGAGYDIPVREMHPAEGGHRIVTPFPDSLQSAIVMAIICPHRTHPDYIPLRLAVMALGGYFGSRLMSNIREEKGLTYGIDASLQGLREGSFAAITAKCDKSFTNEVEHETISEIARLAAEPPAGEELENLKLYAMTSLAKTLDTPLSIMGYYGGKLETAYPDNYFNDQQRVISSLTPGMIAEMADRYLRPESIITSIAGE